MRTIAYDPYISPERGRQMDVELVELDQLCAEADFVTIHLPKTKETSDLFNAERFATMKPGVRIINAARGGIINEADLAAAVTSGQVGGAALDVFAAEPTTESPLFSVLRSSSPHTSVPRPPRRRTRRASRSPSRSSLHCAANSCRSL